MGKLKEPPTMASEAEGVSYPSLWQPYRHGEGRRARAFAVVLLVAAELVALLLVRPLLVPALPALAGWLGLLAALGVAGAITVVVVNRPAVADRLIRFEVRPWFRTWFTTERYKPSQGRKARQLTLVGGMLLVGLGVWRLSDSLQWSRNSTVRYALPAAVLGVFGWICYRLINQARFADFLIATEAEMNKVSWPSWPELRRTTAVVLITMLILAVVLFCYDVVWQQLLTAVGVLRKPD